MSIKLAKVSPTDTDTIGAFNTPDGDEEAELKKGLHVMRVVDHLATCSKWKFGSCTFDGCNETGPLLFHNLSCAASVGTTREKVVEIYKQQNEELKEEKLDKIMEKFQGREDRLLLLVRKRFNLGQRWCEQCKQAERWQKLHSRHCEQENCKVPYCSDYKLGNMVKQELQEKEDKEREEWMQSHINCWKPCCCVQLHKKSPLGKLQQSIERGFIMVSYRVGQSQEGQAKPPEGAPGDIFNACSFFAGFAVIITVIVLYS